MPGSLIATWKSEHGAGWHDQQRAVHVKSPRRASVSCRAVRGQYTTPPEVIIVGAGHNGLVAATLLARQGFKVDVYEQKEMVGGACKTERPFPKAPELGQSTGAYLLGLMPPELIEILGIDIPHMRRDPHYFLPTMGDKYLLFGSDREATRSQFLRFFSQSDWEADQRLGAEISALRDDLAPAWLEEPLSVEETAERYIRPSLQEAFVSLCRGSVGEYLSKFEFKSDLLAMMYAVTDGFTGSSGGWDTPGTGYNFLCHNMCRLPGADGTWKVVQGGMGTVTQLLKQAAESSGATIHAGSDHAVSSIVVENGQVQGIITADGREHRASRVLANCDPFTLRRLAARESFPDEFNSWLDSVQRDGTTMKVNLALSGLPRFSCLPEAVGQHRATIHLLPDEGIVKQTVMQAHADAMAGKLPKFPAIEMYTQTAVDSSLTDPQGRISAALFVQWVPYDIQGSSWAAEEERYTRHLLGILDSFAPGAADLVEDMFVLTPPKIEQHFGISRGHIFHIGNEFFGAERLPYSTPVKGLYAASAGCHPAGSVIGCAGHNAAARLIRDLGHEPVWRRP